jgi:S-adenosylmethionine hydrolase
MSIITLISDYGIKDYFVGAFKGKLFSEFSEANIVDISHNIDLFNIFEASYVAAASYGSFPKKTVHIIAVDNEQTYENKHVVIDWNDHYFIAADNGILSILTQKIIPNKIVEINIHNRLPNDSNATDVFAKVACHLAKGGALSVIGKEIKSLKPVNDLQATLSSDMNSMKGCIVYIDHFGNCVTNISKKMFDEFGKNRAFEIKFANRIIKKINLNYSDFNISEKFTLKDYEGEKLAVFNEAGFLEIAIYKSNPMTVGSAKSLFGLKFRDVVTIEFKPYK